jgi:uncharacterized membrane protein YqjE
MEEVRPEIFFSLRSFCVAGLKLYKTRLEVASIELEEEKERIERLLVLCVVAAVLLLLGLAVVTTLGILLLAAWIGLPGALALCALLYLGGGGALCGLIYRQNKNRPPLFESTLKEFQKDSDCLCAFLQKQQAPARAAPDGESRAAVPIL